MQFGIGPTKTQRALPPIYPPASSALSPHIWTLLYEAIVWSNVRFNHGEIEEAAVYTYCGYFYPVRLAFELRESIPRSALWVEPNGGHGPVFGSNASRFTEIASEFLDGDWPKNMRASSFAPARQ
jgi:hypothetical protein